MLNYSWNYGGLLFKENLEEHFIPEDIEYLKEQEEIISDNELLLDNKKIFIADNDKVKQSHFIADIFDFYISKFDEDESAKLVIFTYNIQKEKFVRENLYFDLLLIPNEFTENIVVKGIDSSYIKINPNVLNQLIETYKQDGNEIDQIIKLRNLISAMVLSDKIVTESNNIHIYIYDSEEGKYIKNNFNFKEDNISSVYYYIFDWIELGNENKEITGLKHTVAKIYLASFSENHNKKYIDREEVYAELEEIYNLVLQKRSKKFYEYNNLIKDYKLEIIQQKTKLKSDLNKKLMNMMVFVPITIYGFYITVQKDEKDLNIFNSDFNIIYISSLIALTFILTSLCVDISHINKDYRDVILQIEKTYKIQQEPNNNKYTISLCDFWLTVLCTIILMIIISILWCYNP